MGAGSMSATGNIVKYRPGENDDQRNGCNQADPKVAQLPMTRRLLLVTSLWERIKAPYTQGIALLHGPFFALKRLNSDRLIRLCSGIIRGQGRGAAINTRPDICLSAILCINALEIANSPGQRCRGRRLGYLEVRKLLYLLVHIFNCQIVVAIVH